LAGELKLNSGQTQRIAASKRDPVIVDMYLDPRIADKVQVRILEGSFFEITNAFINFWPLIRNGDVVALNEYLEGRTGRGTRSGRIRFCRGRWIRTSMRGSTMGFRMRTTRM
jgi:hypothetical protein